MALYPDAKYDQVIVHFDPVTLGILSIKAWNSEDNTEQGTLDRQSLDGNGDVYPGLYNPLDSDISECVDKVVARRKNPVILGVDFTSAALIYKFDQKNEVDVTYMDFSDHALPPYYALVDPIYNAVIRREGDGILASFVTQGCVIGTLRVREEAKDD